MTLRRRAALVVLSSALVALSFPEPGWWPLAFVALAPLLLALRGATTLQGAGLGWISGVLAFALLLRWIGPLSTLGLVALSAYLGLFVAAFGAAAAALARWRSRWSLASIAAAWVALEWARGWVFGGFGWGALGYALAPRAELIQLASLGGVPILSALVLATSIGFASGIEAVAARARDRALRSFGVAIVLPLVVAAHGATVLATASEGARALRVSVVQADVSPRARWERAGLVESLRRYVDLTDRVAAGGADLIVWPETALPAPLPAEGLAVHRRGLERRASEAWRTPILIGIPEGAPGDGFYNAAVLLDIDGFSRSSYRKRRLVPFGEYAPELPLLATSRVLPGPEVVPGDGGPAFAVAGARLGILICFEDVFAEEALARAREADLLAVITNDGWFDASGRRQHLHLALLRAVETRRPIARAASTGISALIDPWGRVRASAEAGPAVATAVLHPNDTVTPYAAFPDALPLACVLLAAASLAQAAGRRRGPSG